MAIKVYQYPIDVLIFQKETGVYLITDVPSGKIYVGSSEDLFRRVRDHCRSLQKGDSLSRRLQEAFNKHKLIFNLKIELLERCSIEKLIEREQYYLDTLLFAQEYINREDTRFLDLGLNTYPSSKSALGSEKTDECKAKNRELQKILQLGSKNGMYGKLHSTSTKVKIGIANSGENEKIKGSNHYLFGKHHSIETKIKISKGGKGRVVSNETRIKNGNARRGQKMSKESREKISKSKKMNPCIDSKVSKKICVLDNDNNIIEVLSSITEVLKKYKISYFILNKILKNRTTNCQLKFKYHV